MNNFFAKHEFNLGGAFDDVPLPQLPMVDAGSTSIQKAISLFLQVSAILSIVYVLVGAVRFTASSGNAQAIATARRTVIFAVVGLAISVTGLAITAYVQSLAARASGATSNPFFGTNGILTILIQQLGFAVGVASVIMMIVGGIRYITSAGQSQSAQVARNTIIYAMIGLLTAFAAQAIVTFVLGRL